MANEEIKHTKKINKNSLFCNNIITLDPTKLASKHIARPQYKYLAIIQTLYITALLATVVLTYKMVSLGPALEPGGVFVFPMTYFFGDVVAEVYGYETSRQLVWNGLICEAIFCFSCGLIIQFPSPNFWHNQAAYNTVLGLAPRFFFANAIATIVGEFINIYAISKWKILMQGKFFWLRSLGSTSIGEAVFTTLVVTIAFLGVMPLHLLLKMIISMYIFKLLYALFAVWVACGLVMILKAKEKVDVYDYNTNFNPFIYGIKGNIIKFNENQKNKRPDGAIHSDAIS